MKRAAQRKASMYLSVGDYVRIPAHIPVPIIYTADRPNGMVERVGQIAEVHPTLIAVKFAGTKIWDYSNKEALQFERVN